MVLISWSFYTFSSELYKKTATNFFLTFINRAHQQLTPSLCQQRRVKPDKKG